LYFLLVDSFSIKTNQIKSDEVLVRKNSLCLNDEHKNKNIVNASFDEYMLSNLNQLNIKTSNQSKDLDKSKQLLSANSLKRESESGNSNISKQSKSSRNDIEDVTVLNNSSSSDTPAVLKSKSAHRFISTETVSRKLSLRSAKKTSEK